MARVLVRWKSEKDHNWRSETVVLDRAPSVGEYIAVGPIPETGCRVELVVHRKSDTHDAEVYGCHVEIEVQSTLWQSGKKEFSRTFARPQRELLE